MKEYLKMGDVFESKVFTKGGAECRMIYKGCEQSPFTVKVGRMTAPSESHYAAHAINSHDELVAEVERLNDDIQDILEMVDAAVRCGDFSIVAKIREKYISD